MDHRLVIIEIIAGWLLTWGLVPHVLSQRQKSPTAVISWVFAILFLPILGGLAYLLIGWDRLVRKKLKRIAVIQQKRKTVDVEPAPQCLLDCRMPELQQLTGLPATNGNAVCLLPTGDAFFERLIANIRSAEKCIHVQFYIWATDAAGRRLRDELTAAARRGVAVRLLLDEIGSLTTFRWFFNEFTAAGGQFSWFQTFAPHRGSFHLNFRNHKKLIVIDGRLAMTGGMNVADDYWTGSQGKPAFHDLQIELTGPAVAELAWQFVQDWYFATGVSLADATPVEQPATPAPAAATASIHVIPGGPDSELNQIQFTLLSLLNRAEARVWIMTPYFVPEPPLLAAMQLASLRGVDVRLLVPHRGDHAFTTAVTRSYYDQLLPHGIRVYEYRPGMLHAKVTLVDDDLCLLGSANMDIRSFRINFELNLLLASPQLAEEIATIFVKDFSLSDRIRWGKFQARPVWQKVVEVLLRPFAPLL